MECPQKNTVGGIKVTYKKQTAYDGNHCINSKRHPLQVIYKGQPMCDDCFDEATDKLVEEFKRRRENEMQTSSQ